MVDIWWFWIATASILGWIAGYMFDSRMLTLVMVGYFVIFAITLIVLL